MFRLAEEKDMEKIIALWQEAFGDSPEEIRGFFKAAEGTVRTALWVEEKGILAQTCLIPARYFCDGKEKPVTYLYAVATGKESRGRGICTALLKEVIKMLEAEGTEAVLVPADEGLAAFYEKRGFSRIFSGEIFTVESEEQVRTAADLQDISPKQYLLLRQQAFEGCTQITLPPKLWDFALSSCIEDGWQLQKLTQQGREWGVLYQKQGEELYIQEVTAPDTAEAIQATKLLLAESGVQRAKVRRSYQVLCSGTLPEAEGGYFNLVLD